MSDFSNRDQVTLERRRIYILPTRHGWLFALIVLVILLGAMNYNNSLAFLLGFLLVSMTLVSILHTYRNLAGLTIRSGTAEPDFAGHIARVPLWLDNHHHAARYALKLYTAPRKAAKGADIHVDMKTQEYLRVDLPLSLEQRGWHHLGRICISSEFPLGLFHAWSYFELDAAQVLAYPRAQGHHTMPTQPQLRQGKHQHMQQGNDDFAGYRAYQLGDSPRHVDWKAVAREQGWWLKQFQGESSAEECWLRWQDVQYLRDPEQALSQLTQWVLQAEQQQRHYGLVLPQQRFEPSQGKQHQHACLQALALFKHTS